MDSSMVQALVNYYLTQGLESSVTDATGILLQRDPNNSFLQFWHAFGLYITGETSKVCLYPLFCLVAPTWLTRHLPALWNRHSQHASGLDPYWLFRERHPESLI